MAGLGHRNKLNIKAYKNSSIALGNDNLQSTLPYCSLILFSYGLGTKLGALHEDHLQILH